MRPPITADGAALWATMVFAFGGPEALAFLRGDVEGGTRQILRVLAVVGALLAVAYIAGTLAMLSILQPAEASRLSGVPDALRIALSRLGLGGFAPAALLLLGLSMLGGYSAWFGVAARLPFVIGVDHYLPSAFARRDARTGAPTTAILVQVAAVIALVLLSQAGATVKGAYDFLVSMSVLSYTLPFVFLFIVYLKVQAQPAEEIWTTPGGRNIARAGGPCRAWGDPERHRLHPRSQPGCGRQDRRRGQADRGVRGAHRLRRGDLCRGYLARAEGGVSEAVCACRPRTDSVSYIDLT